jgi:transcriptional regulator with XRE-family HTH domain
MQRVICLLDRARALCQSDAELAERLDVPASHPAQWRNGSRRMTPATVTLLADLVGIPTDDARRLALQAVVDGVKDPEKKNIVRRVLLGIGKALQRRLPFDDNDTRPGARH